VGLPIGSAIAAMMATYSINATFVVAGGLAAVSAVVALVSLPGDARHG
jgi:hypothetical protein